MFSSLFGEQEQGPSAAETIERLCSRLSTATLLEDRRAAVRGIKAMTKDFQVEVSNQGMPLLVKVLQTDREDVEITNLALEGLLGMMRTQLQPSGQAPSESDVGVMFTEIFVKTPENVPLLLSLLQEVDFHVRFNSVRLLTMLLTNRAAQLQECILTDPTGVSRLMELLSDSREVIRNEGLLLVGELTKGNPAIQKIVAFENAFESALTIIAHEGYSDGDIIVEDCMNLLENLLRGNESNQTLFRETSCIAQLLPFFDFAQPDPAAPAPPVWGPQKVTNILKMVQLVRILVSPGNSKTSLAATQAAIRSTGLLDALGGFSLSTICPPSVVSEALAAIAEVIRGHYHNQELFASFAGAGGLSSLVVVLYCAFGSHRPFQDRCAALYCFQSYLHCNTAGQNKVVAQLFPTGREPAGTLLCQGLFSDNDPLACWFAAIGLAHVLNGNIECKENMLRVAVASAGNQPSSLLAIVVARLARTKVDDSRRRVAFFTLVVMWLHESAFAVKTFLQIPNSVAFLVSQVSEGADGGVLVEGLGAIALGLCSVHNDDTEGQWTRQALKQVINHRVGMDTFLGKLDKFANSEELGRCKRPLIEEQDPILAWFDSDISRTLRTMTNSIQEVIKGGSLRNSETQEPSKNSDASVNYHDQVVQEYKALIRQQDDELQKVKAELQTLSNSREHETVAKHATQQQLITEQQLVVTQQKLEETLSKLARLETSSSLSETGDVVSVEGAEELLAARADLQELYSQYSSLQENYVKVQGDVQNAQQSLSDIQEQLQEERDAHALLQIRCDQKIEEFQTMNKEHEDMLILLAQQHRQLESYRERLVALGEILSDEGETESESEEEEENAVEKGSK